MNQPSEQLLKRRQSVYSFIVNHFTEYDFNRREYVGSNVLGESAKTYREFMKHQLDSINALDDATLTFLEQFISLFPHLQMSDKENMGKWPASGFVFENGKIVIFHER